MASTFSESADDFPPLRGYRNELLYSVERLARASPVSKGNSADSKCDRYLLIETGWHDGDRIYGTLLHIDIIDGKLWIQQDGTEEGIANELVAAEVPKDTIVLGFKSLERLKLTEFPVS